MQMGLNCGTCMAELTSLSWSIGGTVPGLLAAGCAVPGSTLWAWQVGDADRGLPVGHVVQQPTPRSWRQGTQPETSLWEHGRGDAAVLVGRELSQKLACKTARLGKCCGFGGQGCSPRLAAMCWIRGSCRGFGGRAENIY